MRFVQGAGSGSSPVPVVQPGVTSSLVVPLPPLFLTTTLAFFIVIGRRHGAVERKTTAVRLRNDARPSSLKSFLSLELNCLKQHWQMP